MTEIVSGLFGLTPQQLQQQQDAAISSQAQAYGNQDPFQRANAGMFNAGAQLTNAIAPAFGMVNPQMQQAQQAQQVQSQIDHSTPEGLLKGAQMLQQSNPRLAAQYVQAAHARQSEISKEALQAGQTKAAVSKSTLEEAQALKLAEATDINVEYERHLATFLDGESTPQQKQQAKIRMDALNARATRLGMGGAGSESKQPLSYINEKGEAVWGTIVDARGKKAANLDAATKGNIAIYTTGGKTSVDMSTKDYDSAQAATVAIPKIDALLAQLKTGDITTGTGADVRLGIAKAIAALGGKDAAKNATDTEIANVMMGSEVFPLIHSLGIGAKGMDTPAEREFLRSVMTGSISLEKSTLVRMAKMRKEALQENIDKWNKSVDTGARDTFFDSTRIPKTKVGKSASPAPTGKNDFDAKWATLSKGQSLVGPNGKTYVKD